MKKMLMLASGLFVLGTGVIGCSNTAEGVKEDTSNAGQKVAQATDKAVDATKDAAKNTGEALGVTPKIKLAITSDTMLNDTRNLIDVDSKDGVVHLKGHVINNDAKKRATEVAQKAMTDAGITDKLSNELTVETH